MLDMPAAPTPRKDSSSTWAATRNTAVTSAGKLDECARRNAAAETGNTCWRSRPSRDDRQVIRRLKASCARRSKSGAYPRRCSRKHLEDGLSRWERSSAMLEIRLTAGEPSSHDLRAVAGYISYPGRGRARLRRGPHRVRGVRGRDVLRSGYRLPAAGGIPDRIELLGNWRTCPGSTISGPRRWVPALSTSGWCGARIGRDPSGPARSPR